MSINPAIQVSGMDFDEIKTSLKSFLSSQKTLQDYNFDGSVLNTILDILAYNTHYSAFYSNMVANEMFLDSAVLRSSVVSHAKHLGYTPSSIRSAKASVNILLNDVVTSDTFIPRGSEFSGVNPEGKQFKFVNLQTYYANINTSSIQDVDLYEGVIRGINYIYNPNTKLGSYLIIPNDKMDTSTLRIRVYSSVSDTTGIDDIWTLGTDFLTIKSTSKVYFLQEKTAGIYEIYFGDGVLGKQPILGNIIAIEFLETNGTDGNGVISFTSVDPNIDSIEFVPAPILEQPNIESFGGSDVESVGRIKFNAPKFFQSSGRAVTENDYKSLVFTEYPNASSVVVYGGETVTPPQYGTVFLCVKPTAGGLLTTSEKISLERKIKEKFSVVTVDAKIVDPDYIDVVLNSSVVFAPGRVSTDINVIKTLVVGYVFAFSTVFLERFGSNFYYSKFTQGINAIHPSILGVQSEITLRKTVDAGIILASMGYRFDFANQLYHPRSSGNLPILSSTFISHKDQQGVIVTDVYLQDDGAGIVNIVRQDPDDAEGVILVYPAVGDIDYTKGVVILNSKFRPQNISIFASPVTLSVKPNGQNLYSTENRIIRVNPLYTDSVAVTMINENDTIVSGLIV